MPRAASITAAAIPLAGPRGMIRSVSPATPIAPAIAPELSKIGAATLGAEGGSEISVRADGEDAVAALAAIQEWSVALELVS